MSDLELSETELSDIEVSDDEASIIKPTFKTSIKLNSGEEEVVDVGVDDDVDVDVDVDDDDDATIENDELSIDDGDESDTDFSIDPDEEPGDASQQKVVKKASKSLSKVEKLPETKIEIPTMFEKNDSDYESNDDEEEDEDYLQKFDKEIRDNYILNFHPESQINNYDEIYNLAKVQRNKDNIIVDNLHKTVPILTKFEKTKILGVRAKQINNGAKPMITLSHPVIDGYLIALKELEEKKIPVIIRRPLPNNTSEYWHLQDLEVI
ncbi:DNA-directed RNA polymerase subunit omega [Flavobacteriaceae bacterium]|nr:DNA-directed RNA polymerase subunit omega [Flavobacteriaceae bacterium]